ncbi:MAG: glycosyltransferase family protein [Marinilabiliaceae bacterium]|nr:glycosyltransferase family protein [Marinilabiliaceae bacterium]
MLITVNDKTVEALPLIMRKEFAKQIVDGTKKFEVRIASPHYDKLLLDMTRYPQWRKESFPWGETPWREELPEVAHFHNYSNSFTLDVEILEYRFVVPIPETEAELHEWGCHEFDEMINDFKKLSPEEAKKTNVNFFYVLELGEVINSKGL